MAMTLDGSNGVTFNDSSLQGAAASPFGLKNRIINGDMRIDQRNAGASVTPIDDSFCVDRFKLNLTQASKFTAQQNAGSVTPPVGFKNYLGMTSTSAYTVGSNEKFVVWQPVEGFNVADLGWGTASASTVTLSFWVRSSLTGTFGGSFANSSFNRAYPFTYTISVANTWEQKTITVAGDTTGTWDTSNGTGIRLYWSLGTGSTLSGTAGAWAGSGLFSATGATSVVGTNGATFYITGVQLEVGTSATPFERRQFGNELALCQRYFTTSYYPANKLGTATATNQIQFTAPVTFSYHTANVYFQQTMRSTPTIVSYSPNNGTAGQLYWGSNSNAQTVGINTNGYAETVDGVSIGAGFNITFHYSASAEL